jgi:hypothetical protein
MSVVGQEKSAIEAAPDTRAVALLDEIRRSASTWDGHTLGGFVVVSPDLVCRIDVALDGPTLGETEGGGDGR